jgi:DNA-binding MarR family transcriptional regulator
MLKQLKPMVLEQEKRVTANLDPEERSQLLRVLSKLTHERH